VFWCKIHFYQKDIVVGICDEELLGKKIRFNEHEVEIKEEFYKGEKVNEEKALEAMKKATIGNLFGKKIIALAEKHNFVSKKNVILIGGIPHAQFVKF